MTPNTVSLVVVTGAPGGTLGKGGTLLGVTASF
jgi:hypothetical protein